MNPLAPITPHSDGQPLDKVALWLKLFAEQGADPLAMIGVKADGTPVIAAVQTIQGEPFELRSCLRTFRVGDR
jgi:hypothetical protein